MLSNYLAQVWGILLVVASFGLLVKDKHIRRIFESVDKEEGLFLCGVVCTAVGVAQILAHNVWTQDWRVLVTLLGWIALVKGLTFIFAPEFVKTAAQKMESSKYLQVGLVALILIGLVITYFGFKG